MKNEKVSSNKFFWMAVKKGINMLTKKKPQNVNIYVQNSLPNKPKSQECGILNLNDADGPSTHWLGYYKNKNYKEYFDSFENLQTPALYCLKLLYKYFEYKS